MAHYITNSLEEGEQIVFQGHLHWTAIAKYMISFITLLLVAGSFIASGYYTSYQMLYVIGGIILLIAFVIYIIGCVIRTRSEFAVTTTRFIQKDVILDIKNDKNSAVQNRDC